MSTFDETLHPRGQAANAGQFATKANDAPPGDLTPPARTPAGYYSEAFYASIGEMCRAEERVQDAQLLAYAAEVKAIAPQVTQVTASWNDDGGYLSVDEWLDADGEEVDTDTWPDMTLDAFNDFEGARSRFVRASHPDAYPPVFTVPLPDVPELSADELAKTSQQIELEADRRSVPADVLRRAKDALNSPSESQSAGELHALLREVVGSAE